MRKVVPRGAKLIPPQAKRVFKGIIFDVYHWQQKMFAGHVETFEMLRRPDTVKVLAIVDNKIVLLDQEQPHYGKEYVLPGGRNDIETEDELACAKREMHEETGFRFKTWKLVDVWQPLLKIEGFVYMFVATDLENKDKPHVDGGEKIKVELVSYSQCVAHARSGAGKNLPKDLLEQAGSIEGLLELPEYEVNS